MQCLMSYPSNRGFVVFKRVYNNSRAYVHLHKQGGDSEENQSKDVLPLVQYAHHHAIRLQRKEA